MSWGFEPITLGSRNSFHQITRSPGNDLCTSRPRRPRKQRSILAPCGGCWPKSRPGASRNIGPRCRCRRWPPLSRVRSEKRAAFDEKQLREIEIFNHASQKSLLSLFPRRLRCHARLPIRWRNCRHGRRKGFSRGGCNNGFFREGEKWWNLQNLEHFLY